VTGPALRWRSAAATHVGRVRTLNEDACLERADAGLWMVADGMGGHDAGEVASGAIRDGLRDVSPPASLSAFVDRVEDRLAEVNTQLRAMARAHGEGTTIGSTVVVMLAAGRHGVVLWAGDSRVYRIRAGGIAAITTDHSQVQEWIDEGRLTPEEAESHPGGNVITRAIGASDALFLDVDVEPVEPGDVFVLCSDGLYRHVKEDEIARLAAGSDLARSAEALIELTLERGAKDNVTVVVLRAEEGA
jgi:serine/threonine protein phosphatase PrpC